MTQDKQSAPPPELKMSIESHTPTHYWASGLKVDQRLNNGPSQEVRLLFSKMAGTIISGDHIELVTETFHKEALESANAMIEKLETALNRYSETHEPVCSIAFESICDCDGPNAAFDVLCELQKWRGGK